MATCKDCLHVDVCGWSYLPPTAEQCVDFKDRSKYVVREKGEWVFKHNPITDPKGYFIRIVCPKCNLHTGQVSNFCPNCGADMRKR